MTTISQMLEAHGLSLLVEVVATGNTLLTSRAVQSFHWNFEVIATKTCTLVRARDHRTVS